MREPQRLSVEGQRCGAPCLGAQRPDQGVSKRTKSLLKGGHRGKDLLLILHDEEGFAAVSAVCTHLGCIVAQTSDGFECPCHGSRFGPEGRVTQGPAPSPLTWYEVSLAPDGQIIVDTRRTVPVGTKARLG